jgi:hypothetical protein
VRTRSLLSYAAGPLLLVAGVFALAGCGGNTSGTPTTTAATTVPPPPTATTAETTTTPTRTVPVTSQPAVVRIDIEGGKPVGGIKRATVKKGQTVAIVVNSDVADEVHLHGYDVHSEVEAGGSARIQFVAGIAGVFEAELESRGLQILELSVR